jgi:hypothetical protein
MERTSERSSSFPFSIRFVRRDLKSTDLTCSTMTKPVSLPLKRKSVSRSHLRRGFGGQGGACAVDMAVLVKGGLGEGICKAQG